MGKKRIVKQSGSTGNKSLRARAISRTTKRKVPKAVLHVQSHFNNTKLMLTDTKGEALAWSSSGALGFKGAKKSTPFAAAKVGEVIAEKASIIGVTEVDIMVNGGGAGREAAVRSFLSSGITVNSIKDVTPIPHGGCRPRKARRG